MGEVNLWIKNVVAFLNMSLSRHKSKPETTLCNFRTLYRKL